MITSRIITTTSEEEMNNKLHEYHGCGWELVGHVQIAGVGYRAFYCATMQKIVKNDGKYKMSDFCGPRN